MKKINIQFKENSNGMTNIKTFLKPIEIGKKDYISKYQQLKELHFIYLNDILLDLDPSIIKTFKLLYRVNKNVFKNWLIDNDYNLEDTINQINYFYLNLYNNDNDLNNDIFIDWYLEDLDLYSYKEPKFNNITSLDKITMKNLKASKNKVFDIIENNTFNYFCTFTFNEDNVERYDYISVKKLLLKSINNYNERVLKKQGLNAIKYLFIAEQHKDTAWHFHGLIQGVLPDLEHKKISGHLQYTTVKGCEDLVPVFELPYFESRCGYTNITEVVNPQAAAYYITKYITKITQKLLPKGQKIFISSKGFELGKKDSELIPDPSSFLQENNIEIQELKEDTKKNNIQSINYALVSNEEARKLKELIRTDYRRINEINNDKLYINNINEKINKYIDYKNKKYYKKNN